MKSVSAHELLKSHFCAHCGMEEVKVEGDVCAFCQSLVKALAAPTVRESEVHIEFHPERTQKIVANDGTLLCKWEGCTNTVRSHQGLAGFCARMQENGKTHRQMHVEFRRKTDPGYAHTGPKGPRQPKQEQPKAERSTFQGMRRLDAGFHQIDLSSASQQDAPWDKPEPEPEPKGDEVSAEIAIRENAAPPDEWARSVHYGGEANPFEPIKVIEFYDLNFSLGNVIKYVLRSVWPGKTREERLADLKKAYTYIGFEIRRLERKGGETE